MLTKEVILNHFYATNAILKGHFLLSSGLHSEHYLQCAKLMVKPQASEFLFKALAAKITEQFGKVDYIVAPAMGGILVGYEVAKQLNTNSVFVERVEGQFQLRRGFEIPKGATCVIAEDVVTTGLSSQEAINVVEALGAKVVGVCAICDRSKGQRKFTVPMVSLIEFDIQTFTKDSIPDHLKAIPAIKPGSRRITS